MTYAYSAALQVAVYQRLADDAVLNELVAGAIHDAPLPREIEQAPPDYVIIGEESARPFNTKTSQGGTYDFTVTVHSGRDGFERSKRIAGAVCDSLVDAPLALSRGRLVALRFLQAQAERNSKTEKRRVTLRFRAVVDQDD